MGEERDKSKEGLCNKKELEFDDSFESSQSLLIVDFAKVKK